MSRTSNNRNGTSSSINGNEICMLCGRNKQEKNLVCYGCFRKYKRDRIESIATDLKDISIVEWTLKKAEDSYSTLKEEFSQASADLDNFKDGIRDQAYQDVKTALGDKAVPRDDFSDMLEKRRQKLWQEGDGDRFFGRSKYLEFRMINLPLLIKDLKKKIAAHNERSSMPEPQDSEKVEE